MATNANALTSLFAATLGRPLVKAAAFTYGVRSALAGGPPRLGAARRGAAVTYRPLDTLQLFDRVGAPRPEMRSQGRKDYRGQELTRWAARLGVPLVLAPRIGRPNQAPASYAIIAAQEAGGGDVGVLVQAILRAYWAEERDIADDGVLKALLAEAEVLLTAAEEWLALLAAAQREVEDARLRAEQRIRDVEAAARAGLLAAVGSGEV